MEEVRTAVVTGASSGIGAATARALGALGWRVALGARRDELLRAVADEVSAGGGSPFAHPLDVRDPASIEAFFDAAEKELGPVSVLVNNAGIGVPARLVDATADGLRTELETNLLGPMLLTRRALPAMLERGRGDVVFVSSLNSVQPRTWQAGYTASKLGLEGAARVLALELAGTGVRASVVRPGPTRTAFGRDWGEETGRRVLAEWQERGIMRQLDWMPPEDVARAVVTVVTAPPGTHLDVVQVVPEAAKPGGAGR